MFQLVSMQVPRKPPKFKTKSLRKAKLNTNHPRSPYEYSIFALKILSIKKKANYTELFHLRRTLIHLFIKGRITYHGPDCYLSTNKEYLKDFFAKHQEKLKTVKHPDFNRLTKIYYSIKFLVAK